MSCMGRICYYIMFTPWILVSVVTVIFDVVAVGFFLFDVFNTLVRQSHTTIPLSIAKFTPMTNFQTLETFLRHLEMENTANINQRMVISESVLPVPAIILVVVAGRGFLFWCLNIVLIHVVTVKAKSVIFGRPLRKSAGSGRSDYGYERNTYHGNNILEVSSSFVPM